MMGGRGSGDAMAIRVIGYNTTGIDVWHDEGGHGGALIWAQLVATLGNGTALAMPCPGVGCGAVSTHPVAGGCDPGPTQELFAQLYLRAKQGGVTTRAGALALLRDQVTREDGAVRVLIGQ